MWSTVKAHNSWFQDHVSSHHTSSVMNSIQRLKGDDRQLTCGYSIYIHDGRTLGVWGSVDLRLV